MGSNKHAKKPPANKDKNAKKPPANKDKRSKEPNAAKEGATPNASGEALAAEMEPSDGTPLPPSENFIDCKSPTAAVGAEETAEPTVGLPQPNASPGVTPGKPS